MIVLLLAIALAGCDRRMTGDDGGVTSANLADKIEQARTPADHEALARYYEDRARVAQREAAEEHEARTRYERRWNPENHAMGRGARDHYNHLREGHEEGARSYRGMAEWHRKMAERAQHEQDAEE